MRHGNEDLVVDDQMQLMHPIDGNALIKNQAAIK